MRPPLRPCIRRSLGASASRASLSAASTRASASGTVQPCRSTSTGADAARPRGSGGSLLLVSASRGPATRGVYRCDLTARHLRRAPVNLHEHATAIPHFAHDTLAERRLHEVSRLHRQYSRPPRPRRATPPPPPHPRPCPGKPPTPPRGAPGAGTGARWRRWRAAGCCRRAAARRRAGRSCRGLS